MESIDSEDLPEDEWDFLMEEEDADMDSIYEFKCSYPKQKIGSRILLRAEDKDGYIFSDDTVVENFAPSIKINTVYSSDRKISGTTKARSSITVKYGKKTYKTKAGKNGKFSVKVKPQKAGTKVRVSVVTPKGYTNQKTVKTKKSDSEVFFARTIYRTSSSVTLKVYKPRKGDKLILKAAGRTYTKKIKGDKPSRKIVMKLRKKPAAGSKVSVVLKDRFGKKKDSDKAMSYYGNTIAKGMSAANAALTTWGRPIRRNDYGTGSIQWVFRSGDTYLYVYIRGGRVVAIQRINY